VKPFLGALQGIIYENIGQIFETRARNIVFTAPAVAVPESAAKFDVSVTPIRRWEYCG
jgi:hypothetical protein